MRNKILSILGGGGVFFFSLLLSLFFCLRVYAQPPQPQQGDGPEAIKPSDSPIQLLMPEEGKMILAKKARIKCAIKIPFDPTKILVLLDGTDISGVLDITLEGFEYRSHALLPPGEHVLSVTLTTQDGQELKREFKFSTRHSKPFEEIYSSHELTTLGEKKAERSGDTITTPSWKVESNLASESKIKMKEWEFIAKSNLRYFNQNMPVTPPADKGFTLGNYLFQTKYTSDRIGFIAETGDVTIDETPYTVTGLVRRGGNLLFQSKDLHLQLRTFDVYSAQIIGFHEGLGLETTPGDHIMGGSADLGLFSDRLHFRTIYVKGGEEGSSLGISTTPNKKRGSVLGFLLMSNFFDNKLVTEAEIDTSRFDQDTSDEFLPKRDKAYRVKVSGTIKDYNYEALYEYIGRDYEVIGNPGLSKDKQGYAFKAGGTLFKIHLLNLSFSQYHDNVRGDDLYPKTYTTQATIDYTFSKFENLPISLSYQRSMLKAKDKPIDTPPTSTDTDTVTGKVNYKKGPWDLGFSASYSFQNDKTDVDNDTTTVTYSFTPTFTLDFLSICPSFSFNRSLIHPTGVHTNTYTTSLDLKGDLFRKRLSYGLGGTYTVLRSSDGLSKQYTQSANFNLFYLLFKDLWGFLNPSVGIRGLYNRTNDKVLHQTTDEFALYLVLQTTMKFLF